MYAVTIQLHAASTHLELDVQVALEEGACVHWHALLSHHLEAAWLDDLTRAAGDLDYPPI